MVPVDLVERHPSSACMSLSALPMLSSVRVIFKENGIVGPEDQKKIPASQGRTLPDLK